MCPPQDLISMVMSNHFTSSFHCKHIWCFPPITLKIGERLLGQCSGQKLLKCHHSAKQIATTNAKIIEVTFSPWHGIRNCQIKDNIISSEKEIYCFLPPSLPPSPITVLNIREKRHILFWGWLDFALRHLAYIAKMSLITYSPEQNSVHFCV